MLEAASAKGGRAPKQSPTDARTWAEHNSATYVYNKNAQQLNSKAIGTIEQFGNGRADAGTSNTEQQVIMSLFRAIITGPSVAVALGFG